MAGEQRLRTDGGETADDQDSSFATESLTKWTPRFVTNGIDANDLERLKGEIESWDEWCAAFSEVGASHAELGEAAEDRGDFESAAGHFTQASMYYHFGSHVWHEDEAAREEAHRKSIELFARGGEYLDPPLQRLDAPYDAGGFDVPAHLRVPEDDPDGEPGDSPLVVLVPGLDSTKEELSAYDPYFHDRGLATLAVEGAGQGETWANQAMSPEYPDLISAVLDHVEDLDPEGVDTSRVGILGVSLGGFYAPYTAAHEPRFDACVGVSGPYTVGPITSRDSDLAKEQYRWAAKADDLIETDEITEALTMRECIGDLTCPTLALTGGQDHLIAHPRTERIAMEAPNGEYVLYEEGNHVCNNIPYKYKPYVVDWLRSKLA